jgi:hypothetical protein
LILKLIFDSIIPGFKIEKGKLKIKPRNSAEKIENLRAV